MGEGRTPRADSFAEFGAWFEGSQRPQRAQRDLGGILRDL